MQKLDDRTPEEIARRMEAANSSRFERATDANKRTCPSSSESLSHRMIPLHTPSRMIFRDERNNVKFRME